MDIWSNHVVNQNDWRRWLKMSAALVVVAALLLFPAGTTKIAHAASLTVTTTADELNTDGDCSLREAIQAANTNAAVDACPAGEPAPTIDIITFSVNGTITLTSGQLTVSDDLSIEGPGATDLTISGNNSSRVMAVSTAVTLNVNNVTVANGSTGFGGGGIENSGTLKVTNTTFSANHSNNGGAIVSTGTVTVDNSIFSGNVGGTAGAILNFQPGTVNVANTTFSGNSSPNYAGAIENYATFDITNSTFSGNSAPQDSGTIRNNFSGTLTVTNSNFSGNLAGTSGGGIFNVGTLTVTNSIFSGNSALDGGGVVNSNGSLTVTGSAFSSNSATGQGGGIYSSGGPLTVTNSTFSGNNASIGGGINGNGALMVTDSTFSGNSANSGGGIYNAGTLNISTSTFSGNSVSANRGGGIYNDGVLNVTDSTFSENFGDAAGGIFNNGNGTLDVTNSTFSGNSAGQGAGIENWGPGSVSNSTFFGNSATGRGGGIHNEGYLTVTNSTLSGNSANEGGGAYGLDGSWLPKLTLQNTIVANSLSGGNCSGTIIDAGGNLQYPGTDCGATITLADPLTDPAGLQDNGGFTKTVALQRGSPAIDTALVVHCPPTDQRGVTRPQGVACDIGAYELVQISADTTDPAITITTPADGAMYVLGQVVIADYMCEDEPGGSGLASCVGTMANGGAIDTASVGAKTFTVSAADNADNTNSVSVSYNVVYGVNGFLAPVDNPPTFNTAKAGQIIALKWRITDINGVPVTDLTSAAVTVVSLICDLGATTDQIEEYASGTSGLQNLGDGYYQFNWKTPRGYASSCKTLKLSLGEGSGVVHEALFRFTR